jgi:hypothetical protein
MPCSPFSYCTIVAKMGNSFVFLAPVPSFSVKKESVNHKVASHAGGIQKPSSRISKGYRFNVERGFSFTIIPTFCPFIQLTSSPIVGSGGGPPAPSNSTSFMPKLLPVIDASFA